MKIQTILSIAAAGLLAAGCKDSTPQHQSSASSGEEVRGVAIAKLEKPEAEPGKPAAPEASQAAAPKPAPAAPAPTPDTDAREVKPAVSAVDPAENTPRLNIAEVAERAALETSQPVALDTAAVSPEKVEPAENEDGKLTGVLAEVSAGGPAPAVNAAEADVNPAPAEVAKTGDNPAPKKPTPNAVDGDYLDVGFDKLAGFEYEVPEEEYDPDKKPDPKSQPDQIPADVKAFNKKRVALKGFMMPLKVEDGLITEMLIMRDQSACCYGTVPKINEWVSVKMTGKGVKPMMDQTITVYGRLKVGEMRENGYLIGIYEMDGEKITGPLDF